MDLGMILGLVLGVGLFLYALLSGGVSLMIYVNIPSVIMVFGGSFSALLMSNPLNRTLSAFKFFMLTTKVPVLETEKMIRVLVEFSERARREGLLALEDNLQELDDEFMRRGIQLVVDGTDPEIIKSIMYNEVNQIEERHAANIKVFEDWGKYGPAFGMLGTLVGLIAMLANLQDQSTLGSGMAIALITTLYGSMLANMFMIPIAAKLADNNKTELLSKEIAIEGVLSIQSGDNPRILQEKLIAYLPPIQRESLRQEANKD
ncbi:MAG: motility protein A [Spirochaetales bacterium]|jgi:chemotaxis protein MotA|nr:motility protein A [Spirochaetales bacterium]